MVYIENHNVFSNYIKKLYFFGVFGSLAFCKSILYGNQVKLANHRLFFRTHKVFQHNGRDEKRQEQLMFI